MKPEQLETIQAIVIAELARIDKWEARGPQEETWACSMHTRHQTAERQRELAMNIVKAAGALSAYEET
jgi:hypothetical protein